MLTEAQQQRNRSPDERHCCKFCYKSTTLIIAFAIVAEPKNAEKMGSPHFWLKNTKNLSKIRSLKTIIID